MAGITTYLSIITLNVNGLNSPIKRRRLGGLVLKNKTQLLVCYKKHASLDQDKQS
jgi:hypothetical protein